MHSVWSSWLLLLCFRAGVSVGSLILRQTGDGMSTWPAAGEDLIIFIAPIVRMGLLGVQLGIKGSEPSVSASSCRLRLPYVNLTRFAGAGLMSAGLVRFDSWKGA